MTKSYAQIKKQIDQLTQKAEQLRQQEIAGVVSRIKEAIDAYGLTAQDLGLSPRAKKTGKAASTKGQPKAKRPAAVKFRDNAGNTWAGRGARPIWLREALAAGRKLEEFAV
jgi:DNA-binding protein H-NS